MSKFEYRLSARHALTQQELAFCKIYVAMRARHGAKTEAYRRAFWPQVRNPDTRQMVDDPNMPDNKGIDKAATALIGQQHIKDFISELGDNPSTRARNVIYEQAQLADDKEAAKAAEIILEMEDKIGFQDAVSRYVEIMCAIGTEVVVPLPNGGETIFPLGAMFPQYRESLPPEHAVTKTIQSLQALQKTLKDREESPSDA